MSDAEQTQARSDAHVLLIGGSSESADALRTTLAHSCSRSFELTWCPRLALASDHPDAKAADAVLLDVSGNAHGLDTLTQTRLRIPRLPTVVLGDVDDEIFAAKVLQTGARAYLLRSEASTRLLVTTLSAAIESHRTILQLNAARERARHLASHDEMTGLANRSMFLERLAQALALSRRNRQKLAVLYVDLDGFKAINDSLGHAVGDGLLRGIARQLTACLRDSDAAARLGGDEFAVVLQPLNDEQDAVVVATKILEAVGKPIPLRGGLQTTASIGIATFPRDGLDPDDLIRKADTAMYQAKQRGRNRLEFFRSEMSAANVRRVSLEAGLRAALEDQAFVLHYQPQYDLRRERIVGSEALLRWQHPELGLLAPGEFLDLAEESRLIVSIGEWVMRTACRQNAAWQQGGHRGLKISVNVASQQLREPGFAGIVASALQESGLPPASLELEITESSLLEDVEATVSTLLGLRKLGVRLGIDDFGTGYSALAYLKRLPIDMLKIDQSFVQGIQTDVADATITQTIVQMARGLQLTTIAEGVETLEQLLLLGSYGCHRMQGFLFGRPVPARSFERWLTHPPFRWMKGDTADS